MSYATLDQLPPMPTMLGSDPDLVKAEMFDVITRAIARHPRSQQKTIGPSEIGTHCAKCLARKLAGVEEVELFGPAWKPTVGTAVHAWLQDAFTDANAKDEPLRWLTEFRVDVGEIAGQSVTGTCDLYDRCTCTVVDFKIMGVTSLRNLKANGPGDAYRVQAHLYGRGYTRRQAHVERVGILGLPQNGELSDAVWWTEPYDEQVAVDALDRASTIAGLIATAGAAAVIDTLPAGDGCYSCQRYWLSDIPAETGGVATPDQARTDAA